VSMELLVEEIMRLNRSLPPRPGIEEVEAARILIRNLEREEQLKLDGIARQRKAKGGGVSEELFKILQEMQKATLRFQIKEQTLEAQKLLDLDGVHVVFDEMIQRASKCLTGGSPDSTLTSDTSSVSLNSTLSSTTTKEHVESVLSKDDTFGRKSKPPFQVNGVESRDFHQIEDHSLTQGQFHHREKLSLIKLASLIEISAKKGTEKLQLKGKLSDQVDWLPDSIGKLSNLTSLDLSENRILVLPESVGELSSLKMLNLRANRIGQLPESIGNLQSLLSLDLGGNQLKSLTPSIGGLANLQDLDVSSNGVSQLPDTIGLLISLKKFDISTNDIEELPHTIGRCSSLKELRADYNRLKALPEAVGRIETLEILTVRYNNIRQLPTTMASLTRLRELNISFNELESVPESLCFATTLVKLNISNNFADLKSLPRSIGNLEMLEELDMSNNQIRVLPDSFGLLTRLRIVNLDGNPLTFPPRDVIQKGAQAVVQFTADHVASAAKKASKSEQPAKQKNSWAANCCFFSKSNKRKRSG
ncbi:hypothetical protein M569_01614, partial [Genlisea aurea]